MNIDGTAVAYAYNAQGIRTAKRVNNLRTAYLLDGGNVVAEVQNNTITSNYLRGVNLIRRETASETEYYLFNAHGDVVTTTNLNGTINQSYDYDAFGNEKAPGPLDTNPFRYCGEYLDFETGDYYLRARYYAPTIGRFTQQDTHWNTANMIYGDNPQKINEREDKLGLKTYSYAPQIAAVIQSGNLYVYSINNPVQYIDPSGNIALIDDLVVAGLVILATTAVTYVAAPLLSKMLQEMGKTFTDIYNMTAKEIQWLIERASGNTAAIADSVKGFDWNGDKNHILKGSRLRGGHDWSSFGVPPNGDNNDSWQVLLLVLEEVVRNYDKMWQETHANGQTLVYYAKYMAEQGRTIIVKFWMTVDGILKLSDAYLK